MRCLPAYTISERGTTLVEVVASMLVASCAIVGLSAIYLFGLDAQEKASARLRLHETANAAVEEIEEALENARSISTDDDRLTVTYGSWPGDSLVRIETFRLSRGRLFRNDKLIVPLYANPMFEEITIKEWRLPDPRDTIFNVDMVLSWKCAIHNNEPEERMPVRARVNPRNKNL